MANSNELRKLRLALTLLRATLGVVILATWWDNLQKGLYTADGLTGLFNWLFDAEGGNGSSLTVYKGILDVTVLRVPGLFAVFQLIAELLMGLALLVGGFTRLAAAAATFFFVNLFLAYFGGNEWIWVYVLLGVAALAVTLAHSARCALCLDRFLVSGRGKSPFPFLSG
jgi:uncharacterized membrane protein YphA (DoxX/SURF4 family)